MRKFLKIFLRSLGTYLGLGGGLTRPSFIVGFPRMVILITYCMRYFTVEAVSLVCVLALDLTSGTMCEGAWFNFWSACWALCNYLDIYVSNQFPLFLFPFFVVETATGIWGWVLYGAARSYNRKCMPCSLYIYSRSSAEFSVICIHTAAALVV